MYRVHNETFEREKNFVVLVVVVVVDVFSKKKKSLKVQAANSLPVTASDTSVSQVLRMRMMLQYCPT
jgi:hypothetical protein